MWQGVASLATADEAKALRRCPLGASSTRRTFVGASLSWRLVHCCPSHGLVTVEPFPSELPPTDSSSGSGSAPQQTPLSSWTNGQGCLVLTTWSLGSAPEPLGAEGQRVARVAAKGPTSPPVATGGDSAV